MRPVVHYGDLAAVQLPDAFVASAARPTKRRRREPSHAASAQQHWDDPGGSQGDIVYDDSDSGQLQTKHQAETEVQAEAEADECRELTHDEIWDDSALVDAWNAANEEYEVPVPLRRSLVPTV
jgi:hypothetical protein